MGFSTIIIVNRTQKVPQGGTGLFPIFNMTRYKIALRRSGSSNVFRNQQLLKAAFRYSNMGPTPLKAELG